MDRKPEFYLYLFRNQSMLPARSWALTMAEVDEMVKNGETIHTYQVMSCTTDLFRKGYRVFVWYEEPYLDRYKHKIVEITLGTCEALGGRELRMGHNLPRLIVSSFKGGTKWEKK
ncbi:MAG: hypothetical protein J6U28_08710 [Bacteroidales bacterium]|nr:hypothetical protein [Bacteroidales bacterium]